MNIETILGDYFVLLVLWRRALTGLSAPNRHDGTPKIDKKIHNVYAYTILERFCVFRRTTSCPIAQKDEKKIILEAYPLCCFFTVLTMIELLLVIIFPTFDVLFYAILATVIVGVLEIPIIKFTMRQLSKRYYDYAEIFIKNRDRRDRIERAVLLAFFLALIVVILYKSGRI